MGHEEESTVNSLAQKHVWGDIILHSVETPWQQEFRVTLAYPMGEEV